MKAMILAAGEGTRLHPLTYEFPKPLVPVVNRPVMEHIVHWLSRYGIREMVVNLYYKGEQIERYFQDGSAFGVKIHYSREKALSGTAGGVRKVMDHFRETFLVIGGDDLSDVNLARVINFHRGKKSIATIGVQEVDNTEQYGVVVTEPSGKILQFQEKPKPEEALSRRANTGIYIFEPEIFNFIPSERKFDFGREVFPLLLAKGAPFFGCPVEGYWCDIGTLHEYKDGHWAILEGRCKVALPGSLSAPGIRMEKDVSIHPSAVVKAPCILGQGTRVEAGAQVLGHVVTGAGTRIGPGARLRHVITWDHCAIGAGASLQDCVLSSDAMVPDQASLSQKVLAKEP